MASTASTATAVPPVADGGAVPLSRRGLLKGFVAAGISALLAGGPGQGASPSSSLSLVLMMDLFHPHKDPDDHFDLACAFALPTPLALIVLDRGDGRFGAPGTVPVARMNHLADQRVPAAVGFGDPLRSLDDRAEDRPPRLQEGVLALLSTLRGARGPVAIATTGSLTTLAAALNREPALLHDGVSQVLVFAGEASLEGFQEHNVGLDPRAFLRVMSSGLPVRWIPCFDGGLWVNGGAASFAQVPQAEVLPLDLPAPLLRYFAYMLGHAQEDPIRFLRKPVASSDAQLLHSGLRNLWAGPLLGLVDGRPFVAGDDVIADFEVVDVRFALDGSVRSAGPIKARVERFRVLRPERWPAVLVDEVVRLLRGFPVAEA